MKKQVQPEKVTHKPSGYEGQKLRKYNQWMRVENFTVKGHKYPMVHLFTVPIPDNPMHVLILEIYPPDFEKYKGDGGHGEDGMYIEELKENELTAILKLLNTCKTPDERATHLIIEAEKLVLSRRKPLTQIHEQTPRNHYAA